MTLLNSIKFPDDVIISLLYLITPITEEVMPEIKFPADQFHSPYLLIPNAFLHFLVHNVIKLK